MSSKEPVPNHRKYNKAWIARHVGKSRPYVSRVMRGLDRNPELLKKIVKAIEPE